MNLLNILWTTIAAWGVWDGVRLLNGLPALTSDIQLIEWNPVNQAAGSFAVSLFMIILIFTRLLNDHTERVEKALQSKT